MLLFQGVNPAHGKGSRHADLAEAPPTERWAAGTANGQQQRQPLGWLLIDGGPSWIRTTDLALIRGAL